MAIQYDKKKQVFSLLTKETQYQFKIGEHGVLQHLYYGKRVGSTAMDYLASSQDRGHAGQIADAKDDRTFSLDTMLQEYPTFGMGDYRSEALHLVGANGAAAVDLRYQSHSIMSGKYSLLGLPAVYADDVEAYTLEIVLRDETLNVEVVLLYSAFREQDIITRAVKIRNMSNEEVMIKKIASACLEFYDNDYDMITFPGRHAMERVPERQAIRHGRQEVGSVRGISSLQQNPFAIMCKQEANETSGDCYGAAFVYSGNFVTEVEVDQISQTRLLMGINPKHFEYKLQSKEEFVAPEVVLSYSSEGLEKLSHNYHRLFRKNLCRGEYKLKRRPVVINNWEATYFDFDEKKIFEIAEQASQLGVEMFVLDDGWFGKRENDKSGLGDWFVNEEKLKGGLKPLVSKINTLGMKFGLWFEPEMISEDSDLYRKHPEWTFQIPDRQPVRSRYQLVLDMTREDVREYLFKCICRVLDEANVEYIKWDMNRSLANIWSSNIKENKQGEVYHRYVLGVYDLLDKLLKRYPRLFIEGCASGGGRFDAGMLYYTPQIWCSDNTDAIARLSIQYGTSFGYPICAVGAHVSICPNHQTGRTTPFATRAIVAMAGSFGYELDVQQLTDDEKIAISKQIETYKKYQPLIHNGLYSRLSNPLTEGDYVAWQYTAEDKSEALLQYVVTRVYANDRIRYVKLRNLVEDKQYAIRSNGQEMKCSGAALMYGGLPMPYELKEYESVVFEIHEKRS